MINLAVSKREIALIHDIADIGYGEVFDVKNSDDPPVITCPLTERQTAFLKTLRREKRFAKVIVFDGEPTSAEQSGETGNGLRYRKKYRFA